MPFILSLAMLAVLICGLGLLSNFVQNWQIKRHQEEERERNPNKASPYRDRDEREVRALTSSINAIANQLYSYKKQQRRGERSREFREIIIIVVGVIAAFFAGASAWIFSSQLGEMQADQRPWLRVEFTPTGLRFFPNSEGVAITYTAFFRNFGKAPALDVQVIPELYLFTEREAKDHRYASYQVMACARAAQLSDAPERRMGLTVFPGQIENIMGSTTGSTTGRRPWPDQHEALFIVLGCVDYAYSARSLHGRTWFRLLLGKTNMRGIDLSGGDVPGADLILKKDNTEGNYAE
jgi:hypothetical protein